MTPKASLVPAFVLGICCSISIAESPPAQPLPPSEWGEDEQRGAANRITPRKVLAGASLVKEGRIYQLGRVYEPGMPLFGNRHFSLSIVGSPTGGPVGDNDLVWHDEMFSGEIGQIGTQFDGLGHVGIRHGGEDYFFNSTRRTDMGGSYGLEKLGVEHAGAFFTRGLLLDIAAVRKIDRLKVGEVVTIDDLEQALALGNHQITEGDVVLIRTGHGKLWMVDNEEYNSGAPGLGVKAAEWLIKRKVALVGSDTWPVEAVPGEDASLAFPVHEMFLARNGIYLLENLDLERLAADKAYEFAFIFSPLRLKGATGSPGNPIAVK